MVANFRPHCPFPKTSSGADPARGQVFAGRCRMRGTNPPPPPRRMQTKALPESRLDSEWGPPTAKFQGLGATGCDTGQPMEPAEGRLRKRTRHDEAVVSERVQEAQQAPPPPERAEPSSPAAEGCSAFRDHEPDREEAAATWDRRVAPVVGSAQWQGMARMECTAGAPACGEWGRLPALMGDGGRGGSEATKECVHRKPAP